jgi:hypothetical protein
MPRVFTVGQLATRIRERADMVNSTFITEPELRGYISASYAELYDVLVKSGLAYHEKQHDYTTDSGATYALPSDYYGTIGVDYHQDASRWVSLPELMPQERNRHQELGTGQALGFRIVGQSLVLLPTPPAGQEYRLIYVPCAVDLDSDAQTIDGVNGWEEYIVWDSVVKCLAKEESSTQTAERNRQRVLERIEEAAENRALSHPRRVVDAYEGRNTRGGDWWPRGAW